MTTAASRKTWLDVIIIGHCQGDDSFVAFRPIEIFRFWRSGEFTFFERCLQPLYFSSAKENEVARTLPLTLSSLPFCASVQFSCNSIHAFNDRMKIHRNRGLLKVYDHPVGVTKKALLPQKSYQ